MFDMMRRTLFTLVCVASSLSLLGDAHAQDLNGLQSQAFQAANAKVAPTVVAIETQGGTDVIVAGPRGARIRKGTGPTTGVIVASDGYVITSAFNFANKPSNILVAVPGKKDRYVAKVVATDQTRMLTLLQLLNFKDNDLPIPVAYPKKYLRIGMTTLALGRTLAVNVDEPPSISRGIVSAIGRIWGKAVQTDAKVSPTNYGGPLVDLTGKVIGILVPASPRADSEVAGFEWYDSGIGFAMPLEDIYRVLSRMKLGKDLSKGVLGVTMRSNDMYSEEPVIATILPGSAAERAGLKPGDKILEVDGNVVNNYAQVLHQLGAKYEGDEVTVKYERGKETKEIRVTLGSAVAGFNQPFLGILPMRDDPEPGIEVRYVFPKSPADTAGIKAGDRITKIGPNDAGLRPFSGRADLVNTLASLRPGTKVSLELIPQGKTAKESKKVAVTLGDYVDTVPDALPEKSSFEKALTPKKPIGPMPAPKPDDKKEEKKEEKKDEKEKPRTGLMKRSNAARDRTYWVFVPEKYDPNIAHALVLWLHPVGKGKEKDIDSIKSQWEDDCEKKNMILVAPVSENETGWVASELDFVTEAIRTTMAAYTIDRQRVVAHGMGVGGEMAFYLGFQSRDLVRGVTTIGSVLNSAPKERVPTQPLAFFLTVGEKDPIAEAVKETKTKLTDHRFPVVLRELKEKGHQYYELFDKTFDEMILWIDSLDRL
jgi:S1-C subfamily serine protease